ncbi:hypothetical protein Nepgr_031859 [Nepenthes gracilis]|uniref:Protein DETOXIFICATION n=1 Tax=Nepenthes gracilis TaxID=150966 RepID=A0AAD3Y7V3_NEPGR|nr:hypothetical protein Nepgr_031859 [Nepenthes gracilis]
MASALSHHLFYVHSYHFWRHDHHSSAFCCSNVIFLNSHLLKRNLNCSVRLRATLKSQDPQPAIRFRTPEQDHSSSHSSASHSFSLLRRLRDTLKDDDLGGAILSIALPAALALVADPLTSLVDTAFVGHLGSVELAAVGISVSAFNLVSKLFNVPLLNVTTSFVAEEQALIGVENNGSIEIIPGNGVGKKLLPSVSTSLALAVGIGFAEAVSLSVGSGFLMNIMGISVDSPMRIPAEQFLTMRAFGAPPIVIALAAQGAFRGLKDTKTPFYAIGAGNLLNAILDPILIFFCGLGINGAAIATVISEYLIAFILLWRLNQEVSFVAPNIDGGRVLQYLKSGSFLIGRTLAVLVTLTLATSMAAMQGPIPMAGHQICMQVWLAISLLTDSLALAGQALLAGSYTQGNYQQARKVIYRVLQIGLFIGILLAVILFVGFEVFGSIFTDNIEVLRVAWSGAWFVAGSQPINAVAFVLDGLYYGALDFDYAAYSMFVAAFVSSTFLLVAAPVFGLNGIWAGLFLFMSLRVVAGSWRLGRKGGPWEKIWSETE